MVSFLFAVRKEEQQHSNPSFSSVLTDHDRVCLHVSVGDPCCASCIDNNPSSLFAVQNNPSTSSSSVVTQDHQQQLITKKRPQQQRLTLKKNKKPRINNWVCDDDDDHSICLHLMLGSSSCIPTCVRQTNNKIIAADDDDHQWVIKKVLENSDVCLHLCRLLLNKEVAQKLIIPFLLDGAEAAQTKQGIQVQVRDVDTDTLHSLVFKIWISAKMHTFTKRWAKDFVQRRNLKKGDQIGLRWDQDNGRFEFSVLRRATKVSGDDN
ncbi:uncharacterized protein LOC123899240 [Trifolium pratense]|uniref:uncharacterized protein LOC123899240 n=1 Tax=Trifolium pratense TaxID=57577 RepID=UPI001E693E51|nr:uncharacterized protein LOC123899240 [Trifolium pratense]